MTLTASGVIFGGTVSGATGNRNLTVVGTTAINGGSVNTGNANQSYSAAVTLGADTTLTASGVTFGGAVSGMTGNRSLTVVGTTAINGGSVNTGTANQSYSSTVSMTGNTTLTAGTVTLNDAVSGSGALSVVGATIINGRTVNTTGVQSYSGAVTLGNDTVLSTGGTAGVNLASAVDSASNAAAFALTVNSAGGTTFGGALGATYPLRAVTTDASGTLAINGGSVKTTGPQTYNEPVRIGANTRLQGVNVAFMSSVDDVVGGTYGLTINDSGTTVLGGIVGGMTPLSELTTNAGGTTQINGGAITTSGIQSYADAITLGGSTTLRASTVNFVSMAGALAATHLNLLTQVAESLGNVSVTGDLHVTTGMGGVTGGVSQVAGSALNVTGASTFTADTKAKQVASLSSATNSFGGLVTLDQSNNGSWANVTVATQSALAVGPLQSAGAVNLQANGAITTSSISSSGDVTVSSNGSPVTMGATLSSGNVSIATLGGNVTQTGPLNITGTTDINAQSANGLVTGNISLPNPSNTFAGALSLVGYSTTVATSSDLVLGTVQNTGSMSLTSGGSINVGSAFITQGDLTLQSQNSLQLGSAQVGGNVNLTSNAGNITLGTSTITGNLSAQTSGGDIVQTGGALNVSGTSTFNAGAGQVDVNNPLNQFGASVTLTAADAQLSASSDVTLAASSVAGSLTVQSTAGAIKQSGVLKVSGPASFVAPNGAVTLDNVANTFTQTLALNSKNATVVSAQGINLTNSNVQGNLAITAAQGNITQSGPLTVTGTSSLSAPAGNIALANADNSFAKAVTVQSSGSLSLTSSGPLTLGTATVGGISDITSTGKLNLGTGTFSGKLKATSGGFDIVQSGPIKFGSDANFDAGSAKIDLFEPKNSWMGSLLFKGGIVMINHPILINAISAGILNVSTQATIQTAQTTRTAAASASMSKSESNQASNAPTSAVSVSGGSAISISVERPAAANQSGLITVALASDVAAPGRSFSFTLEASAVSNATVANEVSVMQMDGKPLPDWIRYESTTRTFTANLVPAGAFPLQIRLSVGGAESVVVIQEQPPSIGN
jgi:hypothetical protein